MRNLVIQSSRLLLVVMMIVGMAGTAFGAVLVNYSADTLPPPPWEFISNGPPEETSQHTVFVQDGVLHMVDKALLLGNTLGFLQQLPFDPNQIIEVEFRARVLSGESLIDEIEPFEVWVHNGTVRANLSVGPQLVKALGRDQQLLINESIQGTDWHVYRYRLSPSDIQWWVDDLSLGSAMVNMLIPNVTDIERRINFMITSATADVELDYIVVRTYVDPAVIPVAIDIKPSSFSNVIELDADDCDDDDDEKRVAVAILSTPAFDARDVDISTLELGDPRLAERAQPIRSRVQKVDRDRDKDLLLIFSVCDLLTQGALEGDTTALVLTGQTVDGIPIEGSDAVVIEREDEDED
jgi:hypothetical protein